MCLVGAGSVEHETLVKLAEKNFASLPVSQNPIPLGGQAHPPTQFFGADVRVRDDTLNTCNFAIAVEGCGWRSPDYWPMLVMQSIIGNWDRSLGASSLLSSKLSHVISQNSLANSYMSFSTSYSDTGLWGIYMVSEKWVSPFCLSRSQSQCTAANPNYSLMNLDDTVHFTLREWTRMSLAPTTAEVERAKSQLKASLLLGLDGTTAIAEDASRLFDQYPSYKANIT